jgi:hypothetical protein
MPRQHFESFMRENAIERRIMHSDWQEKIPLGRVPALAKWSIFNQSKGKKKRQ